jgi:hypothetical protein
MYRLDRNAFKIKTFQEADHNTAYWLNKSAEERFAASWYLICQAWGIDPNDPPSLDRKAFSARKNPK